MYSYKQTIKIGPKLIAGIAQVKPEPYFHCGPKRSRG